MAKLIIAARDAKLTKTAEELEAQEAAEAAKAEQGKSKSFGSANLQPCTVGDCTDIAAEHTDDSGHDFDGGGDSAPE